MQPDPHLIAELLTIVALIAGTIEYCEVVRRREQRRRAAAEAAESGDIGLRGLVRVMLTED